MDFKIAQIIDHNFAYCAKMFKKYDKTFALFGIFSVCFGTNTYFLKKKVDRLEKKINNLGTEVKQINAEKPSNNAVLSE